MQNLKNIWYTRIAYGCTRTYCTNARPRKMELIPEVNSDLENEVYKPRCHPGINKPRCITLPEHISAAIKKCFKDYPVKAMHADGIAHSQFLKGRHPPPELFELRRKRKFFKKEVRDKLQIYDMKNLASLDFDSANRIRDHINFEIHKRIKQTTYNWTPINYNENRSLVYLAGRAAQEYATVYKVFAEIAKRHPNFRPNSLFDFGAGIGTGTWAAAELWKQSLYEYYLIDTSPDMNALADQIIRDGDVNKHRTLRNVYYRQFLPAASEVKYDIVLCAYSLFELESQKKRLETIINLWNKCNGYLVLIEHGTNAGFKLITEARDFLIGGIKENGHVFAPCPHSEACPRYSLDDGTPCNFDTAYTPLNLCEPEPMRHELYSYIIIKKGPRSTADPDINWPRVVRPTIVRTQHAICKLCTDRGKLENVIITKGRHSKYTFRCGKSTDWGDRLPVTITDYESEQQACTTNMDETVKENT